MSLKDQWEPGKRKTTEEPSPDEAVGRLPAWLPRSIADLDLAIKQGYGQVSQRSLPRDWRTRRRGSSSHE